MDTLVHPFSEKSSGIRGLFFIFKLYFDFFVEVDVFELSVAGH